MFGADPAVVAGTALGEGAVLSSVTYQLLGNPGSAADELRAVARRLWVSTLAATDTNAADRVAALEANDPMGQRQDLRYAGLQPDQIPLTECLKDTVARVLPYWNDEIAPTIKAGKRVVIAAHGNSIRALVKYLDNIGDDEIVGRNIPNGIPLVYELDADLKPIKRYYLGDAEAAAKAAAAVATQGKA